MSEPISDTPIVSDDQIVVDVKEFDLRELAELDGSALGAVLKELKEEGDATPSAHNSHHSHSSFSKHGTALW